MPIFECQIVRLGRFELLPGVGELSTETRNLVGQEREQIEVSERFAGLAWRD